MRPLTSKQAWILGYLGSVTCASEHELAKQYTRLTKDWLKPSRWDAFNMQLTLGTLIKRNLVHMEKDPVFRFRYYSLVQERR